MEETETGLEACGAQRTQYRSRTAPETESLVEPSRIGSFEKTSAPLVQLGINLPIMESTSGETQLIEAIRRAALRILHALVRVLLRHGVSFQAFSDLTKQAYVNVARDEFALPGRKPSISRISILSGLTRKDVRRLLSLPAQPDGEAGERHNRAARVVAGWIRDADFHAADGTPRALALEGHGSFSDLVRRHSGDVPARAVFDELERVGTVERDGSGNIRLLARVYIPRRSDLAKLAILGSDVSLLIGTIDHNLQEPEQPRLQRKVMYDNLPIEAVEELRPLAERHAQQLIELLDAWMAQHDRDANPSARGTGRVRAGLGIFCFEQDLDGTKREK
jgi:hypothetical protein